MSTYEVLTLLILFGSFLVAFLPTLIGITSENKKAYLVT